MYDNIIINKPAIFWDRDGTLIEDTGCITEISQVRFYPFTIEALNLLKDDFKFFIVTHQPWISRGNATPESVNAVNQYITDYLAENDIIITEVFCCPHTHEEECECKKPKPYFIRLAEEKYGIDVEKSFTVGDHLHDVDFGFNAGGKGLYVLTGHGQQHLDRIPEEIKVFENILAAAKWIKTNTRMWK